MRLETRADLPVAAADLYAVAADLRNLPAWWIEHLSAEIETPAVRARDAVYRVRYRLPGGLVISAVCTMVAARPGSSLTYLWNGGGMRLAVGQSFAPFRDRTRTKLAVDLATGTLLTPFAPLVTRIMRSSLRGELDRALTTLGELASARTVVRRTPVDRRSRPAKAPAEDPATAPSQP